MPAHPWLAETPWPTKQLPRDELERRLEHFLATHWMGVLCTLGTHGPIGSPVEYYAEVMDVYVLPQPGSPKVKAMQRDPRVCFAVYGENAGWPSVQGAQLFGDATFVEPGTPAHEHAMTIYRWAASAEQLGQPLDAPPRIPLIRISPTRIVYTQQWLRKEGFGPRQIWHRDPNITSRTIEYGH
ncbi:MAG: pyridoxamine 5'-phosphate oxidase family protein [Gammaproteobacteria bacterium]|nr:pyridoxamine 5'-phosphate oxidase family protein [Gammaproteobacteria bacterium]